MGARPWHRRWHGNALNGMRGLSLELRGAYQTLLDLMYDSGGPVRLDERRQAAEMDADIRVFRRVMTGLLAAEKLHLWSDGKVIWIVNQKVLEELGLDGFETDTSAELPAEVREKFAIATRELSPKSNGKPRKNNGSQEKTAAEKPSRERGKRKDPPVPPEGGDHDLFGEATPVEPVDEERVAFDAWNALAARCDLPVAKALDDARRRAIRSRLKDGGLEGWNDALEGVERSAFCRGQRAGGDGRKFKADLGFVCQAKSFPRLREGYYGADAKAVIISAAKAIRPFPHPGVRNFVLGVHNGDEVWVRTWLDPCDWDGQSRTIIAPRKLTADRLREDVPGLDSQVTITYAQARAAGKDAA